MRLDDRDIALSLEPLHVEVSVSAENMTALYHKSAGLLK